MAENNAEIITHYETAPEGYDPLAGHPDPESLYLESLNQGTTLAGREKPFTWELDEITSEGALHRYRAQVEIEALINLAERGPVDIPMTEEEKDDLRSLYQPEVFDPSIVIRLDHLGHGDHKPLEHDVKSVEVYVDELLDGHGLGHFKEWVHFGMTSEDTNNLAYNLMLRDATNKVLVPSVSRVADRLAHLAAFYADSPTLGITHAQPASPTTVGKQFGYLLGNVSEVAEQLEEIRLTGKFAGAVGNHNPMPVLFEGFDYDDYAQDFVEGLGFDYASVQNQRNNHLAVGELFDVINRLAVVGKDASDNAWLQIRDLKLVQKLVDGERGSSTMPQKINPWRLENDEALFEQAIALISRIHEGIIASRDERDLSDHGWERAYGDIIGRVVAGYNYFAVQLDRLMLDEDRAIALLNKSPQVLSELIQTAGRVSGDPGSYDKVVEHTQGRTLNLDDVRHVVDKALPDHTEDQRALRDRVKEVTPDSYIGVAAEKAREAVLGWHAVKFVLSRGVLDEGKSVDAVLFDFDGTLHFGDKDELLARLTAISDGLSLGFDADEIAAFGARSDYLDMRRLMVEEYNRRHSGGKVLTEDEFQEANDVVSGSLDHHFYAADGVHDTIYDVRESGKKTGLVTTRGNKSRDRLLTHHGLDDAFDVIVGRGDAENRKPHPQPIAIALEQLGIERPDRSLYVGDLQTDDIGAGRALGMKTALVGDREIDPHGPIPTYQWKDLEKLRRVYGRR